MIADCVKPLLFPANRGGISQTKLGGTMKTITLLPNQLSWLLDHLDAEAIHIWQDLNSDKSLADGIRRIENKEELEMIDSITNRLQHSA